MWDFCSPNSVSMPEISVIDLFLLEILPLNQCIESRRSDPPFPICYNQNLLFNLPFKFAPPTNMKYHFVLL